jgi:hypothetical protein
MPFAVGRDFPKAKLPRARFSHLSTRGKQLVSDVLEGHRLAQTVAYGDLGNG